MKNQTQTVKDIQTFLFSLPFIENICSFQIVGSKRINSSKFITHYIKQFSIYSLSKQMAAKK